MVKAPVLAGAFFDSYSIVGDLRKLPRIGDVVDLVWVRWFLGLTWDFVGEYRD